MEPIRFGMIGAGWRSEFFFRIAQELPERFVVTGVLVRSEERGAAVRARWGFPTFTNIDELLADGPAFVVVSVPWAATPVHLEALAGRQVPALAETPPAPDVEGLIRVNRLTEAGARIQVAEQYHLQPLHAARIAIARSGLIGTVSQAQVSAAHGYHGVSLIRRLLDIQFEDCIITAHRFSSPLVGSPDRTGPPRQETIGQSSQTIAYLDFGNRIGVFDFTGDQYFSWIRSPRVLVRGERGEINNTTVRYLHDYQTPVQVELLREDAGHLGNLEGYHHKGYLLGTRWAYRNPYVPGRLSDDEIAVTSCLDKMAVYAAGGPPFYSAAEASQDHYLGMCIDKAATSGSPVATSPQPWTAGQGTAG